MKSKRSIKLFWIMFLICSICSVIYMTLAYSKFLFHSDCAGYLFLAKEQLKQGKMFPNRFHYTTEIFGISPNLLMIPFLTFLDNEYLIHEMGTICYTLLIIIAIFVLFYKEKKMGELLCEDDGSLVDAENGGFAVGFIFNADKFYLCGYAILSRGI